MRASDSVRRLRRLTIGLLLGALTTQGARAQSAPQSPASDAVAASLDSLRSDANGMTLDRAEVRSGARTVEASEHVPGDVASYHGALQISGTVDGNAAAIGGDVVLLPGGHVRGDALSVGGQVKLAGGTVDGEMRSISAFSVGPLAGARLTPAQATRRSLSLAVACYLILVAMALAVSFFARGHLETIGSTIRTDFSRAFLFGLLGEIAIVPLFLLSVVALAITIVGVLLIPFAAVAFALGVMGALALGFLAMSLLAGDAIMRGNTAAGEERPVVSHLITGLSLFLVLWLLSSASAYTGLVGSVLRLLAVLSTWIAATVGLGALIITRGGTRAAAGVPRVPPPPAEEYAWQTPTPVSGVAAARRPTPAPRPSQQ
ncbi:MAG TPA: hypothetical protein VIB98_05395 [Gemmatimonadaceae bacterium]